MSTPEPLLLPSPARLHALAEWLERTHQPDLAAAALRAAAVLEADAEEATSPPTRPVTERRDV